MWSRWLQLVPLLAGTQEIPQDGPFRTGLGICYPFTTNLENVIGVSFNI